MPLLRQRQRRRLSCSPLLPWPAAQQQAQPRAACHRLRALQVEAPSEAMDPVEAWALLTDFTTKEARGTAQPLLEGADFRRRLRDALLVAAGNPHTPVGWSPHPPDSAAADSWVPEVLMGVLASDMRYAVRSLRDYCQALGVPFKMPDSRVPGVESAPAIKGPVYLKYNSGSGLCYATQYDGRDRGVLVQLGQKQLGHLPLGLHDEGMDRPPPAASG